MNLTTPRTATLSDGARLNILRRRGLAPSPSVATSSSGGAAARKPPSSSSSSIKENILRQHRSRRHAKSLLAEGGGNDVPPLRLSLDSIVAPDYSYSTSPPTLLQRRSLEPLSPIVFNAESPAAAGGGTMTIGKTYAKKKETTSPPRLPKQPVSSSTGGGTLLLPAKGRRENPSSSRDGEGSGGACNSRAKQLAALKMIQRRSGGRPSPSPARQRQGEASPKGSERRTISQSRRQSTPSGRGTPPSSTAGTAKDRFDAFKKERAAAVAATKASSNRTPPLKKRQQTTAAATLSSSSSSSVPVVSKLTSDVSSLTLSPAMKKIVSKYGTTNPNSLLQQQQQHAAPPQVPDTPLTPISLKSKKYLKKYDHASNVRASGASSAARGESAKAKHDSTMSDGAVSRAPPQSGRDRRSWAEIKRRSLSNARQAEKSPTRTPSPRKNSPTKPNLHASLTMSPLETYQRKTPLKVSPRKSPAKELVATASQNPYAGFVAHKKNKTKSQQPTERGGDGMSPPTRDASPHPSARGRGGSSTRGGRRAEMIELHNKRKGRSSTPSAAAAAAAMRRLPLKENSESVDAPKAPAEKKRESLSEFGVHRSVSGNPRSAASLGPQEWQDGNVDTASCDGGEVDISHKRQLLIRGRSLVRQKQLQRARDGGDAGDASTSPLPPSGGGRDGVSSRHGRQRETRGSRRDDSVGVRAASSHSSGRSPVRDPYALPPARPAGSVASGRGGGRQGGKGHSSLGDLLESVPREEYLGVTQSCSFASSSAGGEAVAGTVRIKHASSASVSAVSSSLSSSSLSSAAAQLQQRRKKAREVLARRHGR